MKLKLTSSLYFIIFITSFAYGQMGDYNYKREIQGINESWHKVILPNSIFKNLKNDLSDIRVFGIKPNKDTIEAPYSLKILTVETKRTKINFLQLNESHNQHGYFFTFDIPTSETINQIHLAFSQANFDWKVSLQASMDNQEWFSIIENYRILSIKNDLTNYQFTKLNFSDSKYRYYRILIPSIKKPILLSASISLNKTKDATFNEYSIHKIQQEENHKKNTSSIDFTLDEPVAISNLKIRVQDTFDYYRPINIKYLTDSIQTEKGWIYNYRNLTNATLSSVEKNEFNFNSTTVQKLKIVIENGDNEPLLINDFSVNGYKHELLVRFNEPADYFLVYGNKNSIKPQYDISKFLDNIPTDLNKLKLNEEVSIEKIIASKRDPLFENKLWLWVIMGFIIIVLGWFSINMIKKQ